MKLNCLIPILLLAVQVTAQMPAQVKNLLEQNRYRELSVYIDSINQRVGHSSLSIHESDTAALFDGVIARTIHLTEMIPFNGMGNINNYRINILLNKDQIAYFRLTSRVYSEKNGNVIPISVSDSFKNKSSFDEISSRYQDIFDAPLLTDEIWSERLIYGWSCGMAPQMPEGAKRLLKYVKMKQADSLRTWLRSPDPVKQLYAIEGFIILGRRYLTSSDKRVIEWLITRDISIAVCDGCDESKQQFKEVLDEIISRRQRKIPSGWQFSVGFLVLAFLLNRRRQAKRVST